VTPLNSFLSNPDAQREFFGSLNGVIAAYLFGSHAHGNSNSLSDYDIALLFAQDTPRSVRYDSTLFAGGKLTLLLRNNNVDVISLNDSDSLPLKFEVISKGRTLYSQGDDFVDFEIKCRHEYFDYKSGLQRLGILKG